MDIDPGLNEFISRYLNGTTADGLAHDGYFRFTRGRNASSSRSCGVDRVEIGDDGEAVGAQLMHLIEKLIQDEYRSPQNERNSIFLQYVERGSTRHRDWCCVFDAGSVADALTAVGGPLGADLAGRLATGVIAELLRMNRDLHTRSLALLDSQCEMALSVGTGGTDMSEALAAMQPTLAAIGDKLPEILQAHAMNRAASAMASKTAPDLDDDATPQQRCDDLLQRIGANAHTLADLIMNKGAKLNAKNKKQLRDLGQVIATVTA